MEHEDKMEISYKLIVSKSQRALFMQTGTLGTAIPETQKNQDIELQNVYQVKSFVVQKNTGKVQEEMKQKIPASLHYNASLGINLEEKGCLLIGI